MKILDILCGISRGIMKEGTIFTSLDKRYNDMILISETLYYYINNTSKNEVPLYAIFDLDREKIYFEVKYK